MTVPIFSVFVRFGKSILDAIQSLYLFLVTPLKQLLGQQFVGSITLPDGSVVGEVDGSKFFDFLGSFGNLSIAEIVLGVGLTIILSVLIYKFVKSLIV